MVVDLVLLRWEGVINGGGFILFVVGWVSGGGVGWREVHGPGCVGFGIGFVLGLKYLRVRMVL